MKPGFFLREALRSVRRNKVPSFAATAAVLLTSLVIGVFIPVVQATNGAANDIRGRVLVDVFLKTGASAQDAARVQRELVSVRHVKSVQLISKDQALAAQRKLDPQAYQVVGFNPLPDTLRVTPDRPDAANAVRAELDQASPLGTRLVTDQAIDGVRNRKDQTDRILSVTRAAKLTMGVLAILLVVGSALLVSNTIRLSLFARRREVEVMKLVGATDAFIRWPFVIEGLMLGALGGTAAVVLLVAAKVTFLNPLSDTFTVVAHPSTVSFGPLAVVLMVSAVGVSAAGSGLSLRRFLRV